jgi:UDPglucose 6-dehydrogenase
VRVSIIGCGYVGLVSGVCLAARGHDVICVDVDELVVEKLNRGLPHIFEQDLDNLLRMGVAERRFAATTELASALGCADIVIIAVGTPSDRGAIDLKFIRQVARKIGGYLKTSPKFLPIVVKSTVVPGTTDTLLRSEIEATSGKLLGEFGLGMNPEFLREGEAVADFMEPDRIVMGHEDEKTLAALEELYRPWTCDKLRVNARTAELIKYANNAILATQISAINEIANLAAALGNIDIMDVVKSIQCDRRWSPITDQGRVSPSILTYLVPGCGFGGSCFPKDLQALRAQGREHGLPMDVLDAVLKVNDAQPQQIVDILVREGIPLKATYLLLGLAFKPGTDDVRESASIKIALALLAGGADLIAHDPVAMGNFKRYLHDHAANVRFVSDWRSQIDGTDVVIIATKWPEYEALCSMDLTGKVVFDARRLLDPQAIKGARYLSIGRRN